MLWATSGDLAGSMSYRLLVYPVRIGSDSQRPFSSLAALLLLNVGQGYAVVVAPNQQQKCLADFSPPILAAYTSTRRLAPPRIPWVARRPARVQAPFAIWDRAFSNQ